MIKITKFKGFMQAVTCLFLASSFAGQLHAAAGDGEVLKAQRPIKLIVPFPPGGGGDIAARLAAKAAADMFGQPIIVENKGGAGGAVGSEFVAKATPDGYTLEMASADTHSIYPHVYTNHKFRAAEFRGVTPVVKMGFVLVGRPGLEAKNVSELIALSRQRQLSFSSWGAGNSSSLAMAAFMQAIKGPEFLHVPYQGAGPAAQAVLAGQVDLMMMPLPIAKVQDKLVQYGILSAERSKFLPNLPTLKEQKIDLVTEAWIGILAPPKTPAHIVEALSRGFVSAMSEPSMLKTIEETGMTPYFLDAASFQDYLGKESTKWARIAKEANVRLD